MATTWKSTAPLWVMVAAFAAFSLADRQNRAAETERLRARLQALEDPSLRAAGTERVVVRQPIQVTQVLSAAPADPSAAGAERNAPAAAGAARPDEVEERFRSEPRGPGGARGEGVLGRAVSSFISERSSVESIECRASLCRLELVHPDIPTSNALIEKLFIGPGAALHGASFVSGSPESTKDGSKKVVLLVPSADLAQLER
jgi:hypothetical protein